MLFYLDKEAENTENQTILGYYKKGKNVRIYILEEKRISFLPIHFRINIKEVWYKLVLNSFRPHAISQKVLRVEHCYNILQKARGLSLKTLQK